MAIGSLNTILKFDRMLSTVFVWAQEADLALQWNVYKARDILQPPK